MTSSFARNALVLGLLSVVGPLAIDMYLPALPSIAADLDASTGATQMSLMALLAAVAVGQVFYGPISDMVGRRPPLYFGLGVYAVGAIGCGLAPSIEALIAFRFVQGIGACAGMTIPRAVVRDLHTGPDAARLMSLVMLVFSVAPILAPLSGSALMTVASWRGLFFVIAAIGLMGLGLVAFALPETRPPEKRIAASLGTVLSGYGRLLRDRHFMVMALIGGLGIAAFFAFIASSSFVYIEHFGLTPTTFSLAFSINAVGFIGAAQFSAPLARRFGFRPVVRAAVLGFAAMTTALLVVTLAGIDSLVLMMVLLFAGFGCLGLVVPSTAVLALEDHGPIAGMAAALMGTLQMVAAAGAIGLTSLFFDGTSLSMVAAIATCSLLALALSRVPDRRTARRHPAA
ncbi:MAG TPA: multidrug effflux MFS transporter [Bauldia sp.]|nr:multidrug effflux MFS transporter [Bauldia sp.]